MLKKITAIPLLALNIDRLNLTVIIRAGSNAIIEGINIKFMGIVIYTLVKYNSVLYGLDTVKKLYAAWRKGRISLFSQLLTAISISRVNVIHNHTTVVIF